MYIKNDTGPEKDPSGTPAWISVQDKRDHLIRLFPFCRLENTLRY